MDDSISSYIDGLPELANKVTLRQLLAHTSGFGDIPDIDMRKTSEYIDYIRKQPMLFEPGTKFYYSNAGYVLLGAVIEKVSEMTQLQEGKLLSQKTWTDFTKSVIPTYFSENISWGYGFMIERWNGIELIDHNGGG